MIIEDGDNQMQIRDLKIDAVSDKITLLALSWRDIESPESGGAEVQTHAMLSSLPQDRFRVIHLSALFDGMNARNVIDGITYLREGTIYSVIWVAYRFYLKNKDTIDIVIDQCNTHRFFTPFYIPARKRIFYIHQMTREIWRVNMRYPLCLAGELLENAITGMYKKGYTVTVSESTRKDLVSLGFDSKKILIIPQMLNIEPWDFEQMLNKESVPTFVYVGRYAPYKGIDVAVEALGILKKKYANARLRVVGKYNEDYVNTRLRPICEKYGMKIGLASDSDEFDVICYGFVPEEKKLEMISRSHALVFPSIREGWGIPISEAAFVGTPSIVFDSPGIRDAVNFGEAGYVTGQRTAESLAESMQCVLENKEEYEEKRQAAYDFTKNYLGADYAKQFCDFLLERYKNI